MPASDEVLSSAVIVQHLGNAIVRIILNRPQAMNAINADLLHQLVTALQTNSAARVIILEGAGDRAFCAGEDLKQTLAPKTGGAGELREALNKLQDVTRLTASTPAIVIAAVQGFAVGGGAEIALAADFVIGGLNARFRFPEAVIGHAVTNGISLRLVQLVGLLKAKQLLLTGSFVDAKEALRIGMLSEIADDPKERAFQLAIELAKSPAVSLAASKTSVERAVFSNLETCLHDEVNVASYCFAQNDASEAFSNFAARKQPTTETQSTTGSQNPTQQEPKDTAAVSPGLEVTDSDPSPRDLNSAWQLAGDRFPSRTFLRCEGQDFTFYDFEKRIAALAGGLKHLGVEMNDRVFIMMRNSIDAVCSWLAVNRIGAIWIPINTGIRSVTLVHAIKAAEPKLALVDNDLYPEFTAVNAISSDCIWVKGSNTSRDLAHVFGLGTPVKVGVPVSSATTAAFLYTSGTTGKSKPCVVSHGYFVTGARTLISGYGLRQDDVLYCPFPLCHADATTLTIVPAILLGATAAIAPSFSASRFWEDIRTTKATVYDFMGATLALTFKQPPSSKDRDHRVRLAWGVPLPSFAHEYETRFGHRLVTLYGSVEANLPISQDLSKHLPAGSCGRARSGYHVRIANDFDEAVPNNTPGQILVRSDAPTAIFDGYYKNETATLDAFKNLWFHTGDIGKIDDYGNIYFIGRRKDVIRRRGENVNAAEVEEEFMQHPDVIIAAAYGIPSLLGRGTEEDVKVAVKVKDRRAISEKELWVWARSRMARFQVPSVIQIVENIPQTPTGKIEKRGLTTDGGTRFELNAATRL